MTDAIVVDNHNEAAYYGVDEPEVKSSPIPTTEEVLVCNAITGECEEVTVEAGHTPLAGTEIMQVPLQTSSGMVVADAIVVDNQYEAAYYGVEKQDPFFEE